MSLDGILPIVVLLAGLVGFVGHALMLARNPTGTAGGLGPNWETAPVRRVTSSQGSRLQRGLHRSAGRSLH